MTATWEDQEGFRGKRGLRHFHRASKGLGVGTRHPHSQRCDGLTTRTCRMTWERRQPPTLASLSLPAGICPAADLQGGIVPLPYSSPATSSSEREQPTFSGMGPASLGTLLVWPQPPHPRDAWCLNFLDPCSGRAPACQPGPGLFLFQDHIPHRTVFSVPEKHCRAGAHLRKKEEVSHV